jgi:(+)-trans-carveol dehydrogenase
MTSHSPDALSFDGQVVLITGAARGQGRSHALGFARAGARVVAIDLCAQIDTVRFAMARPGDLAETVALVEELGGTILAFEADVRSLAALEQAVAEAVARLGRVDVVVANAGIGSGGRSTLGLSEQQWEDVLAVNLGGVWRTAKAAVPAIVAGGRGGSLVITGSAAGLRPMAGIGHYVAAKHGLVGLTKTLAIELAPHDIRVNCVHPTGVRTPMATSPEIQTWAAAQPAAASMNLLPVDMVEPEDVTEAILWLASSHARYVTGVNLPIDAGYTIA